MAQNRKLSLFDCLTDILIKKSGGTLYEHPDFKSAWNTFMISRYLTMDAILFNLGVWLDGYGSALSPKEQYLYLYIAIPKRTNGYIQYIAKKKEKNK